MSKDSLGDRMKGYELREAGRRCLPLLPICARIDGKRFSRFTQDLPRPYDERLSRLMIATARHLLDETGALVGYTQSDEISLVLYSPDPERQVFLDGRIQKLTSILASMATAAFNARLAEAIPEKAGQIALFDCRVWTVPTLEEAANTILWREMDAAKNSISMAARARYSHDALHGKSGAQMQEMLFQAGVNWNDYPAFFKRGTFLQRRTQSRRFTAEELDRLPPRHAARANPDLRVERVEIQELVMPPFAQVANRVGVIFGGEIPQLRAPEPPSPEPS